VTTRGHQRREGQRQEVRTPTTRTGGPRRVAPDHFVDQPPARLGVLIEVAASQRQPYDGVVTKQPADLENQ